ncbi:MULTISPECIES: hypothetical protein [unclassified Moorena]|uniref:hypothetical protein n=1 Tax=unclassified Moorena TaxID=2683338 RepID=UPI0013B610F7|nr:MULTISPECIES: hypothetical protein [unclassified Moorena]NEP34188.1 hypothetical protein [Moorena sp. SIO3B2]NEQ09808.1 hypothetical protein [Moorena sp. SIO4E2]
MKIFLIYSQLPTPDSRLPIPDSRFPTPDSRLPAPCSLSYTFKDETTDKTGISDTSHFLMRLDHSWVDHLCCRATKCS